ncbi:glycoside hydrolase family 16 protein [Bimuria novae-zelandiae CBS 107.79]|uniref:Glycoside hydrolase family 16 protein n=1 Tax=Bimuria novae-zelandiae CBS 107.79 TaxID=1447943 RepID=A0A6A5UL90_9PLEO|nr:glycoside hydrolase family 16 protein [Bimuria novae-zelandiae CBS 107.79]
MYTSALLALATLASPSFAAYKKVWDYNSSNFWDNFNFVDLDDSHFTGGFAQYVGIDEALSSGLARINNGKVRLGVDSTNTYSTSSTGRKSLRLQSYGYFDNGLLVGDFAHVPVAGCGQWPAFWVYQGEQHVGSYAEIDILENVNVHTANTHSLYTSDQCTINIQKGNLVPEKSTNCHWKKDGPPSQGCSFNAEAGTFNQPFNNDYKVVALQVESERIRIWHFKKTEVPADLNSASPNPDAWTKAPTVHITPKSCDFHKAFNLFHIVINTSFCGSWAGDDFNNTNYAGQCAQQTGVNDCKTWVAQHPSDFVNTFWEINSIKLFQRA